MVYLITAGAIAFSAYVWLLQHVSISTVVTHQYVNPVVAVALAWLLLDESLPLSALAGAALIVLAVATIVRQESRAQPRPAGRLTAPRRAAVAFLVHETARFAPLPGPRFAWWVVGWESRCGAVPAAPSAPWRPP